MAINVATYRVQVKQKGHIDSQMIAYPKSLIQRNLLDLGRQGAKFGGLKGSPREDLNPPTSGYEAGALSS